jgi:uncharacterized protein (DUF2141 family)
MPAFFSWPRLAFMAALLCPNVSHAEPPPAGSATVSANVGPLRALEGSIACRLFKSPEGFPYSSRDTITVRVKATATMTRCTFEKLPAGTYAVVVHHDENENRKLDKNRLGMPLEGYGVSNNRTHALSAPRWEEAKFVVEPGETRELTIALRY